MPQVVSVTFKYGSKPLWFDPRGQEYQAGEQVLVETERGREVGTIEDPAIEATDRQIKKLKSPLKPVIRALNDLDFDHLQALKDKGALAMPIFREKVEEYGLDIKPVEVLYLFSGERATFYFSSEERIDFRDLVRDLAQQFHIRVDMRQIGARDEAREMGGLAHCGEEFCCTRFGSGFQPVSIRMAKEQDLPLNPLKISGACGRLMCCLRYEYEAYKDFKKRAPKKGTAVDTPLGEAVIIGYNTPRETMELKLEDGKKLAVPLAEMECEKGRDGCMRCSVNHDTIERCATRSMLISLGSLEQRLDGSFDSDAGESNGDRAITTSGGERRRRRRGQKDGEEAASPAGTARAARTARDAGGPRDKRDKREKRASRGARTAREDKDQAKDQVVVKTSSEGTRRRRRRSSGADADTGTGAGRQDTPVLRGTPEQSPGRTLRRGRGSAVSSSGANARHQDADAASKGTSTQGDRPRPGQRSSGLRKPRNRSYEERHAAQEGRTAPEGRSAPEKQADHNAAQQAGDNQAGSTPIGHNQAGASAPDTPQGDGRRRRSGTSPSTSSDE
ncbi:MAG: hypothetical protein LBJ48_04430 [Coriobacteriales bacterium]|jgi:cell fate regulator YaaT (PSP1 superfamily)|nr:hypothetical protein [Coriobacteriales bacterium]